MQCSNALTTLLCSRCKVVVVMPTDGMDEIQNPFIQEE
jgi:hypothetical protein